MDHAYRDFVAAAELLARGNAELTRLRIVRGAYKRTWRRMQRALELLALGSLIAGVPLSGRAHASTSPMFLGPQVGDLDVGKYSAPEVADIDGDGDLDLFVAEGVVGDVTFVENTGSATHVRFADPVLNPFGLDTLRFPTFADIDGDGDLDAFGNDFLTVFLQNTGTATAPAFAAPVTEPFGLGEVGYIFEGPAFVDIDGDGDLDAFLGDGNGTIAFKRNTGTAIAPAFSAAAFNPFGLVMGPQSYDSRPAFADIDGDGDMDAFVGESDGNVTFFRNTGTAADPAFAHQAENSPLGLSDVGDGNQPALADIDGDGDLDAFVGEYYGQVFFFRNTQTDVAPSFANPATNPFGLAAIPSSASRALVDIDGDGDLDMFYASGIATEIFENTGSAGAPAFGAASTNPFGLTNVPSGIRTIAFADIDGDGDADAFVRDTLGDTIVFENTGTAIAPAFAPPSTNPFGLANAGEVGLALVDIDADGDLDAFVGDISPDLILLRNTGSSTAPAFAAPSTNPFGLGGVTYGSPAFVDIDLDGDFDALIGDISGNANFFENTGTAGAPAFAAVSVNPFGLAAVGFVSAPAFGDIDSDGDTDVFIGDGSNGNTVFFENTMPPLFTAFYVNPFGLTDVGTASAPALADLDADGDLDALIVPYLSGKHFFENSGTANAPAFSAPSTNPFGLSATGEWNHAFGDIDADGDIDLMVGSVGNFIFYNNTGTASVPAFAAPSTNPFGLASLGVYAVHSPELGDLDGDGDLDVLTGDPLFFENTGTTAAPAFSAPSSNPFGLSAVGLVPRVALADIDGDGDLDALFGTPDDNFLFINTGTANVPSFAAPLPNPFGLISAITGNRPHFADIDGDGDLDVFVGAAAGIDGNTTFLENVSGIQSLPAGCPPVRDPACVSGFQKGMLLVKENTPGKEKVIAKLVQGPALVQTDFGDPLSPGGTIVDLCIYDDQDALVGALQIDRPGDNCAGEPCWKAMGDAPPDGKGYLYKDGVGAADGVRLIKLKGGAVGKSLVLIKGRNDAGAGQTDLPTGIASALSSTTSATVQVRGSDAVQCLSTTLSEIVKQESDSFKAK